MQYICAINSLSYIWNYLNSVQCMFSKWCKLSFLLSLVDVIVLCVVFNRAEHCGTVLRVLELLSGS